MKNFSEKKVEELTFHELKEVREIIDKLPLNLVVRVENEDGSLSGFEEISYDIEEDWFDVDDSAYEAIVGKCFANPDKTEVLKVIGLSKGLNKNRAGSEHEFEFIYERFYLEGGGWEIPDYIWLQETVSYNKEYEAYRLSDLAELNIASENMYHLGKDGKLYVDMSCCGDYEKYEEVSEHLFLYAKEIATEYGTVTYEV